MAQRTVAQGRAGPGRCLARRGVSAEGYAGSLDRVSAPRVLYSFPHRIGAGRICYTAWEQVDGIAAAGADVTALVASVERPLPPEVQVAATLARGRWRIPYRLLGQLRALTLHDRLVARRLP